MAKVPYKKLLTEAISEFDTSKASEVKGPFLDPILSWDGGGELPTNKAVDAGSILERYYFKEKNDDGVDVMEADYGKDDTVATSYETADEVKGKSTDHTQGAGTEQAGTDDGHNKADKREKEIAKEGKEDYDLTEDLENSIIEKIISEMEEEDEEEEKEEEMKEGEDKFEGVKKSVEAPDEKEMKDPEEHSMGAGTPQAGTGDMEGEVPDRKDMADKMVKPKNYSEASLFEEEEADDDEGMDEEMKEALSLLEMDDEDEDEGEEEMEEALDIQEQEEEGGEEEEELDVDKKMAENYPAPGGPTPHQRAAKHGGDGNGVDIEEAFRIFQEQMEDDEDEGEEEDED